VTTPTAPIKPDGLRSKLVEAGQKAAQDSAGKAYKYSGKDTGGFDCSGFVSYVYSHVFSSFPYMDTKVLESGGQFAETTKPQPGDLIFFPAGTNPYEVARKNMKTFPDHVGIVIDASTWMGSQSSTGVAVVKMTNPWWGARSRKFLKYKGIGE
jgi:cell wall-associated NlpC family hydrolase